MATYTATLQDLAMANIWENKATITTTKWRDIIAAYQPVLFDFDYVFPGDPANKDAFEKFFIQYFYMREIGFETENIFKMRLEILINLNYEKWRLLYEDFLSKYDIRIQQDMMTTSTGTETNVNTQTGQENIDRTEEVTNSQDVTTQANQDTTDTATQANLFSDTADDRLSITNWTTNLVDFASTVSEDRKNENVHMEESGKSNASGKSNSNMHQDKTNRLTGNSNKQNSGTISQKGMGIENDNEQYRQFQDYFKTFYEIIIQDLSKLFMSIY